jgi:hypothetical protein
VLICIKVNLTHFAILRQGRQSTAAANRRGGGPRGNDAAIAMMLKDETFETATAGGVNGHLPSRSAWQRHPPVVEAFSRRTRNTPVH